jgi:hypothetical protein
VGAGVLRVRAAAGGVVGPRKPEPQREVGPRALAAGGAGRRAARRGGTGAEVVARLEERRRRHRSRGPRRGDRGRVPGVEETRWGSRSTRRRGAEGRGEFFLFVRSFGETELSRGVVEVAERRIRGVWFAPAKI